MLVRNTSKREDFFSQRKGLGVGAGTVAREGNNTQE